MPDKILNQIFAGRHPIYEIVEPATRPGNIIIRVVDDHEKQFELPKGTLGILADMLNKIYEEHTLKKKS